jgi:hypothetical protein
MTAKVRPGICVGVLAWVRKRSGFLGYGATPLGYWCHVPEV